jgi:ATP-dependent Clp protease adaptor protein ClpS
MGLYEAVDPKKEQEYLIFELLSYIRNMNTRGHNSGTQWQTDVNEATDVIEQELHNLIVWNDDVNTFDWVIESLVDICGHDSLQAEQCAMIVHFKGKCGVKRGSFNDLRPQAEALIDRGIQATIDY